MTGFATKQLILRHTPIVEVFHCCLASYRGFSYNMGLFWEKPISLSCMQRFFVSTTIIFGTKKYDANSLKLRTDSNVRSVCMCGTASQAWNCTVYLQPSAQCRRDANLLQRASRDYIASRLLMKSIMNKLTVKSFWWSRLLLHASCFAFRLLLPDDTRGRLHEVYV